VLNLGDDARCGGGQCASGAAGGQVISIHRGILPMLATNGSWSGLTGLFFHVRHLNGH
jgi:hypothetical protein